MQLGITADDVPKPIVDTGAVPHIFAPGYRAIVGGCTGCGIGNGLIGKAIKENPANAIAGMKGIALPGYPVNITRCGFNIKQIMINIPIPVGGSGYVTCVYGSPGDLLKTEIEWRDAYKISIIGDDTNAVIARTGKGDVHPLSRDIGPWLAVNNPADDVGDRARMRRSGLS